MEPINW